jgi:hypothetical protein
VAGCLGRRCAERDDDIHFETDQFGSQVAEAFGVALGPSALQTNLTFLIPELAQTLYEGIGSALDLPVGTRAQEQKA